MDSSEDEMLSDAVFELEKDLKKKQIDFSFTQSTNYQLSDKPSKEALKVLFTKFGHKQFRPMQWQIINSILKDKRDNCAIMTTGYGKSLCFQFPAVFSKGITIVISPLISLMEDQVLSLTVANIPACLLGMAQKNTAQTLEGIFQNKYSLVYLSPELCTSDYGRGLLNEMASKVKITLIAIDEAHCVSSWGHDFRHSFRHLGMLKDIFPGVPILAVTATATEKVRQDIIHVLRLRNPQVLCSGLDRPNLYFDVRSKSKDIFSDLRQLMVRRGGQWMFEGPTIIYCLARKNTEELSDILKSHNIETMPYHAGLSLKLRQAAHESFMKDKISVIVATIAFGMGIDKPDIRTVIHYGVSGSLEAYYQEVGRAGRDGLASRCVTFYGANDFRFHNYMIEQVQGNSKHKKKLFEHIKTYLLTIECRRKYILKYFEGSTSTSLKENKNCCDNCSKQKSDGGRVERYDFAVDVTKYLAAVETLGGTFGHGMYVMFIKGSKNAKIKDGHRRSIYYGCGADKSEAWWKALGNFLEMKGYLSKKQITNKSGFSYYIYSLSHTGTSFLSKPESKRKLLEVPSGELAKLIKAQLPAPPPSTSGWTSSRGEIVKNGTKAPVQTVTRNTTLEENFNNPQEIVKLFRVLKNTRTELARSNDCMPYMISSDYILMEIAKTRPNSLEELRSLQIEGLTEAKISKFGEKFVGIVQNNCAKGTGEPSTEQKLLLNKDQEALGDPNDCAKGTDEHSTEQKLVDEDQEDLSDPNDDLLEALCDEMQKQANEDTQFILDELSTNQENVTSNQTDLTESATGCTSSRSEIVKNDGKAPVAEDNSNDAQDIGNLYRVLKNGRTELARENDIMPYMISSDYILMEMAKKKPKTLEELTNLQIEGFTEAKINKFGPKFVDIIRNNCSIETQEPPIPPTKQPAEEDPESLSDPNDDLLAALCDEMQRQANEDTPVIMDDLSLNHQESLISNQRDLTASPLAKKFKTNEDVLYSEPEATVTKKMSSSSSESTTVRTAKKKLPAWLSKKRK